jgi:aspartyl-tRNA(Asn)/glutamyl-tRNA(Gln) amidotransferase subunit B
MNERTLSWDAIPVTPENLADLISRVNRGELNLQTARMILSEIIETGKDAGLIVEEKGLKQIHDSTIIGDAIAEVFEQNQEEVESYLAGKETLAQWFFGQVMAKTRGQASPAVVKNELEERLRLLIQAQSSD